MPKFFYGKKGQGITGEYVVVIVLVSISIMVMTTYVRRTLQARYRDGNRMIYVKASGALGNAVYGEYEPYYVNTTADTDSSTLAEQRSTNGGGMDWIKNFERKSKSLSVQKPF